ncbi:dUTPase [Pontibacillus yanchengensis]|uniref:dUTPase n=2 Tax=Pontibacillus yanchengensis TaxID=462910 RepID=A0ACC7VCW5_9BACI|nr:dUTP diphosphatase [Pontibacillus yanchengensis]MYL34170.1 dUTPase [Pontibacillus yanchengensis]MYL53263.1 dUTPase [Pontibacillus yanchengensis]
MNWNELFQMQQQLDQRIEAEHGLEDADLFSKKVLALLVELGELANETRCFKFWSLKPPKEQQVILEEYVDGLHFIMSLGLEKTLYYQGALDAQNGPSNTTEQFQKVFSGVHLFQESPTQAHYEQLFTAFLRLGITLGFSEVEIQEAYYKKNEVNHQRQEEGY